MGHLFPINPVSRSKPEEERVHPIGNPEEDRRFSHDQDHSDHEDQLEDKVNKLINDKKFTEALDLSDLDNKTKSKLLELTKNAAATFLKKELLNIAKSILSISVDDNLDEDDIDDEDLPFADQLARLVIKLANNKKTKSENSVKNKVGKTNPLEDRNAGFLVHYCKDILNQKIKQQKNNFKLEKLNKKDLTKYLKK